jgi:hypothetical protein
MKIPDLITWKNLSQFGENRIINRSYIYLFIVPVFANLFSKIKSPLDLIFGENSYTLLFELPFSWKMFFFSALLFSIASLLYSLNSPSIIKENKSFGDFIEHKKNFNHLIAYLDHLQITNNWVNKMGVNVETAQTGKINIKIKNLNKFKFKILNDFAKLKLSLYTKVYYYKIKHSTISSNNKELAFWEIYNFANQNKPIYLILTSLFYLSGFILITIVIFQGIILVLNL